MPDVSQMSALDEYLQPFAQDFRRKGRHFWAKAYIQGLLSNVGRKTMEGIARAVELPKDLHVEDAWQALQNFIQESPWDDQCVMRTYRRQIAQRLGSDGVLAVEDIVLPKQGQHSVGVHRQYSPEQGKKINCQILTTVFLVGRGWTAPLSIRLYMPRAWQEDAARMAKCKVPSRDGVIVSKIDLAIEMLKELREEGFRSRMLVGGESYARSQAFLSGIAALKIRPLHLATTSEEPINANSPIQLLQRVRETSTHMKDQLGLDHFEGRTWRGLHHHLCLVALARGFELHQMIEGDFSTTPAARELA